MKFHAALLKIDGKALALRPDKSNSFDEIYADFQTEEINGGTRWTIFLHPKQDVTVQQLEIQFQAPMPENTRFFANGYQSWSESRLYRLDEPMLRLRSFAKKHLARSGDEYINNIPRGAGKWHSWTYTYFKKPGSTLLAGSLSERSGFTLCLYDRNTQIFTFRKDLHNLPLSHSFPALDCWIGESTEQDVFNAWFDGMGIQKPTQQQALGWTSWYRHFTDISEKIVLDNLEQLSASGLPFQFVQIDDGWQTAVGDWFSVKPAFPNGMAHIARKIQEKNMTPGLWLAPFVASGKSELAQKHPEWLLKDTNGKPLKAGWNPLWGGWYYALDFYNNQVRDYISGVFHLALDKWGYELLKLDFLFAVCLAPPPGKTRGAVMCEAMEFLRNLMGHRKMLACGVPLGACFGVADFCRIGGDMHLRWEHRLLAMLRFRERLSCIASLRSTIGRRQLNGLAFGNDPDVFFLRNDVKHLNPTQQNTILTINALLGKLCFTSDNPGDYDDEQKAELETALELGNSRIRSVDEPQNDLFVIHFDHQALSYFAYCNLSSRPKQINQVTLLPYETMILRS